MKAEPSEGRVETLRSPMILTVAFPYAAIGHKAVGGAEVICTQMESALSGLGYRSVVVANAASETDGQLYPTHVPLGIITEEVRAAVESAHQGNIDRALAEHVVSLVHMHGLDFHRYRLPDHVPVIVTLHLPPSWYPETLWSLPKNYCLVCVSESQRRACPRHAEERVVVIENGVELPGNGPLRSEGRYALMLARICPEKNLHTGLDAARMAGMAAMLAGDVYPYETHLRYFAEQIQPRLTVSVPKHESRHGTAGGAPVARFLGPVSGAEKRRLLQRAACLLLPTLAPETSSLVAMEALAAGTPVIGMAVGAVPEIVEHERTGFLVQPGEGAADEMAAAIQRLPEIDRELCQSVAAVRFSLSRMVESYHGLYQRFAFQTPCAGGGLRDERPAPAPFEGAVSAVRKVDMVIDEVREDSAFEALIPAWTELFAKDTHATPFQHPAWLIPWWHQFGPDGELHVLSVREGRTQELLGLLPLYTYPREGSAARTLLLVGAGTTDYLDGVWDSEVAGVAEYGLQHILDEARWWDRAGLYQLRAESPLQEAARGASLPLVVAELCSSIDTRLDLPAKIRANTGRYRRRAHERGDLVCGLASTAEEALASFDALASLHRQRWESRGERGVLNDARVLAHHRESLPWLLDAGLLRLFHLRLAGETAGVLYGLADAPHAAERRLYLYLIGFDPRFAECSPGTLLLQEAWLYARENGFTKLDLLRGGEGYKQLWGAQAEATWGIELMQCRPESRARESGCRQA